MVMNEVKAIQDYFKVVEKDNSLWLTCRGVPFCKVDSKLNAKEISEMLDKARTAAIDFMGLKICDD